MKKHLLLLGCFITLFTSIAQARPHISIGINLPVVSGCYTGYSSGYYPRYYSPYASYYSPYGGYPNPICHSVYVPSYLQTSHPTYAAPVTPVYVTNPTPIYQTAPQNVTIIQVQTVLKQRKYYNGVVDGLQGPATQTAIRNYQVDRNLTPNGRIDSILLNDLGL